MNRRYCIYRRTLICACTATVIGMCILFCVRVFAKLPDEIKIIGGRDEQLALHVPVTGEIYTEASSNSVKARLNEPVTFHTSGAGTYTMNCRLFGIIPIKNVDLYVVEDVNLIPAGIPIGIYVETDGILVIGTGKVQGIDGLDYDPAAQLLQSGDYIERVNGMSVRDKQDLITAVNACGGNDLILDIRRNGERFPIKISPVITKEEEYKLGVWVRDNIQGIGTLTFVNQEAVFGALGHGINDMDTSMLMEVDGGTLYQTEIISVVKGESGNPGELTGVISYLDENVLGEITLNTKRGIFGVGNEELLSEVSGEALPIGLKQDIRVGEAQIISSFNGEKEAYQIEITKVDLLTESVNRGIVLRVTDERLLAETGGIVQGMSGSPIIQDGKIVGAVTHVFVQDASKGYGIFIEEMLEW
ncbi:MAG TPA: SpoIVB peptidase [Lachnospiraceae bacterium]|jgi:stage IV sporulation protein B|nr:SpoIVB peptidase [Lachnospiraceae bacterium]